MENIANIVGKNLRSRRHAAGLTIFELRHLSDVSSNMISRIERGITLPSVAVLVKLADAFNTDINSFVYGTTAKDHGPSFFFEKEMAGDFTLAQAGVIASKIPGATIERSENKMWNVVAPFYVGAEHPANEE